MKNNFAQLYVFVHKIDKRYLQLAYFVIVLASLVLKSPTDGGVGPH
jgi:hypothetical protein